jgi:hypothetical protein
MSKDRKSIVLAGVAAAFVVGAISLPALAVRIGYWDAAAPGTSIPGYPGTVVWLDQSSNEYDFVGAGTPLPFHDDVDDLWLLGQNSGFKGIGDEDLFDFETDVVAGPSNGAPFSVNAYLNWEGPNFGDTPYTIMTKARKEGTDVHFTGHSFALNWSEQDTLQFVQQAGNNTDRVVKRLGDSVGGSLAGRTAMLTVTHDGSGTTGGTIFYVDGVEITRSSFDQSSLNGTVLNGGQIEIGRSQDNGNGNNNGMSALLYFLEIYDHELSVSEVSTRFNGGSPTRATQDPVRNTPFSEEVSSLTVTSDSTIEFQSEAGETYQLQSNISTNTPEWIAVGDNVIGTGGIMQLLDPEGFSPSKMYRVFRLHL